MVFKLGYNDTTYLKRCVISMAQRKYIQMEALPSQIYYFTNSCGTLLQT